MQSSSRYPEMLRSSSIIRLSLGFTKPILPANAFRRKCRSDTRCRAASCRRNCHEDRRPSDFAGFRRNRRVQNGSVFIDDLPSQATGFMTGMGQRLRFIRSAKDLDYCSEGRGFRLWRRDVAPSPDPRNTDTQQLTCIRGCFGRVRNYCRVGLVHSGRHLTLCQIRAHSPKSELFLSSCNSSRVLCSDFLTPIAVAARKSRQ